MAPCGSTLEEQLSSIMAVLTKAAVSEISQLFSEGSTTLRLQITRSLKENKTLKARVKGMRSELLSLRLQTRSNASRASSRLALARTHICKPRTKPLGNEHCDAFGDSSTQRGATSESLHVDAPGSSHMSSHNGELRILSVFGKGAGPLVPDGHDTLFTTSEVEALSSLSADRSVATGLERGERLVRREELSVQQQTPDTISIKVEEDLGGGMPAVEGCNDIRDSSTQRGATSESLHVDAPGSSHMSSHKGELRILSVHGKGEGPLAVDGHDTLFTASELEASSSLSADRSVATGLDCSEPLVHHEELTGHRGGCKGRPGVLLGKGFPDNTKTTIHMRSHTDEKPYECDQCMMRFLYKSNLKIHMRTHSGEKPYRCDQCMNSYQQKGYLKIHMRTHSGEKPYRCDQCMNSYTQKGNLKIHMRTHSGEKPYSCDQCMKCFSQSSNLKLHMWTHSGEKPCVCLQCNASFGNPTYLRAHMLRHTGNGVL